MMRRNGMTLGLLVALALLPTSAVAQDPPPPPPMPHDSLEVRVRQRMGQVVKARLGLSDEQMRRLTATNHKFELERRTLMLREREVRMALRDELESGDTTRNAQVSALLDRMLAVQRSRLELLEAEQKELASFLTPLQRARYFGMEEQIRRRVMEMQERGMGGPPGGGMRRPPGGGGMPMPGGGMGPAGAGARPGGMRHPPAR